ncbi:flagellar hook-basal body complex protein FliE [Pseudalkalibacillus berkeleyi]|uniref:Flagellar hook-basal body complex protein FliE n=1 Tax=Pseudalkalibacillus berkeleyi TaxID=1069813 RepID=A0ABS9GZT6_9BACL|nr:flagellar hook-basal body complex protein FliE [Pseudalkalibacillus berkeleyi]MCF6137103.1 flagellar hook-basal body complex protein FliE [Pseudalkalibacillus berkeleyi]
MNSIQMNKIMPTTTQIKPVTPDQARSEMATSFKEMLQQVNDAQLKSDAETEKLVSGKSDNLHNVMITAEKASITLQTAVEVRNKAVEAYQEIMRMQV